MKFLIALLALTTVITSTTIQAADGFFNKKSFLEETGITEECNDTAFLNCLGVKENDCHSSVKICSDIFPTSFSAKQGEKLIRKFSSCMLEKNKVTGNQISQCDQKSNS